MLCWLLASRTRCRVPERLKLLKGQAFKSGSGQEFKEKQNLDPKIEARPCQGSILGKRGLLSYRHHHLQPHHMLMEGLGGNSGQGRQMGVGEEEGINPDP